MSYKTIQYEIVEPHIARITLNRPERMNALNRSLLEEVLDALQKIERDDQVHVYLLTGAPRADGRPCFSAGVDLKARAEGESAPGNLGSDVCNLIDEMLKPSIGVVDGTCTTGGLEMIIACDLRIAAETAQFSDWHMKRLGAGIGGWGAATRLTRIVGLTRAKEMILTGMTVDGNTAERIGLVNRVYTSAKLMDGALEMARAVSGMRPEGVRLTLAFLDSEMDMQKHQALRWAQTVRKVAGVDSQMDQAAQEFSARNLTPGPSPAPSAPPPSPRRGEERPGGGR